MVESAAPTDALDLRLAPRDHVRIDGRTYDLTPLGDLSVSAQARLRRHADRIAAVENLGEKASADDEREYEDRLRAIVAMALPDLPPKIAAKLSLGDVRAVVVDFSSRGAARVEKLTRASRSRTSSRTSLASTALANGS